jgi:hypothetical protein
LYAGGLSAATVVGTAPDRTVQTAATLIGVNELMGRCV